GNTQRILGWTAIGAGVIGIGIGIIFELKESSKVSDRDAICPSNRCTVDEKSHIDSLQSEAETAGAIGTTGLIAGGVLAAGGLTLLFTAPKKEAPTARVVPVLGQGFAGVRVTGRIW